MKTEDLRQYFIGQKYPLYFMNSDLAHINKILEAVPALLDIAEAAKDIQKHIYSFPGESAIGIALKKLEEL